MGSHGSAAAQSEPLLGQIMCAGFNFAPRGWALLDGQIMSIAQNTALFSLLGTTYGGNGQTTYALPDMRGRVIIHPGQGPGLSARSLGEIGGQENVTLNSTQLPAHNHTVTPLASAADATVISPLDAVPATKSRTTLYAPAPGTVAMSQVTTSITGSSSPVPVIQPYVGINCFIAIEGVFPSRP
jgi:microcystin-dependent protein